MPELEQSVLALMRIAGMDVSAELASGLPQSPDHSVAGEPDVQLLACRRLLHQEATYSVSEAWHGGEALRVEEQVAQRMNDLLLAHPVLMHPRFLWDYEHHSRPDDLRPLAPFLHDYAAYAHWPLPVALSTVDAIAARDWASHPALSAALTRSAPTLRGRPGHVSRTKVVGNSCAPTTGGHPVRLGSLLALDRLRATQSTPQDVVHAPCFMAPAGRATILKQLVETAAQMFAGPDRQSLDQQAGGVVLFDEEEEVLREIASSPSLSTAVVRELLMDSMYRVFFETTDALSTTGTSNPVNRLHRFVHVLVRSNAAESQPAAATLIAEALFRPPPNRQGRAYRCFESVGVDVAQRVLLTLAHYGVALATLDEHVRAAETEFKQPIPNFAPAVQALRTEESMAKVLGAVKPVAAAGGSTMASRKLV